MCDLSLSKMSSSNNFKDLVIFKELNEFTREYARAKEAKDSEAVEKAYKEMILRFMAIKTLNSNIAERLQKSREKHEGDKDNIDRLKLKSANLNYKREHLVRDVELCKTLLTPSLNAIEEDIGKKLAVNKFTDKDNLDSAHNDALQAMDQEIVEREQAEERFAKLNNVYEATYNRYDKKRKFLEQDAPAHLEKIKELMDAMNDDFRVILEKHEKEQQVLTDDDLGGDGPEDAEEEEEEDEEDEEDEEEAEGNDGEEQDRGDGGNVEAEEEED